MAAHIWPINRKTGPESILQNTLLFRASLLDTYSEDHPWFLHQNQQFHFNFNLSLENVDSFEWMLWESFVITFKEKLATLEVSLKSNRRVHGLAYVSLRHCRTGSGNGLIYPLQPTDISITPMFSWTWHDYVKWSRVKALYRILEVTETKISFDKMQSLRKNFSSIRTSVLHEKCNLLIFARRS